MAELNFTPEQRAAIDTRGSTVLVSAAAGSGKTRVLTERLMAYLTDAENPVDIDRFLVITYTRAAAAELRSRILDGIYARIASDPENRRLRRQAALCARAEIGTIHSFCADFLRANCAALALAPDFQVADTERCITLRTTALEHTLERAYMHIDTDAPFRLLADTVGGGRDDARLGELVLTLYDKMQCHARPEQWAAQQVELLALDGVTDAGATPWGRSLLARVRESAAHWAGVLDEQLSIMTAHDMEWLYGIYGTSFGSTAAGLRAVVRACDQSWDTAVVALQDVPFPRLGSTRKPPDPDVRDRVKAQRDAAKKAIQTLQKQINIPSAQALADLHTTAPAMQALLALTLWVIARSFLKIATATGSVKKVRFEHKAVRAQSVQRALCQKELRRFAASPNYMLNCGLGIVMLTAAGIALLIKGRALAQLLDGVFGAGADIVPVLLCAALCLLASMNDMAAPSVSLEGRQLWLAQSLPVTPWQVLRAKLDTQLLLTGVPVLFCALCAVIVLPGGAAEMALAVVAALLYTLLSALAALALGLKMPNLTWTNEITPIKQGGSVMLALFANWFYAIALGGLYFLCGRYLSAAAYLAIFAAVTAVACALLLRWLKRRGTRIFAAL